MNQSAFPATSVRSVPTAESLFPRWCIAFVRILAVLTLLIALPASGADEPAEVLSNSSVIELKQLGLGDGVIVEKINASTCRFDLTLNGLKALKAANLSDAVISAMLAASKPPPSAPTASTNQTQNPQLLPAFYGLHAVVGNSLVDMKRGGPAVEVPANVEFIYYAKTVTAAEAFGLFELPSASKPVPTIRDGKFKGWEDFMKQSEEHYAEISGLLNGLPRGSVQVQLRIRSVPNQPEMIRLAPVNSLSPGDYQVGISGGAWYPFAVRTRPVAAPKVAQESATTSRQVGPGLVAQRTETATTRLAPVPSPPEVLQNPAYPLLMKAVEAQGGLTNLWRSTAMKLRHTGRTTIKGQGVVELAVTFYSKYPDQMRQDASYELKTGRVEQNLSLNRTGVFGFGNGKAFSPSKETKATLGNEVFMQRIESLRPLLDGSQPFALRENVVVAGRSYPAMTVTNKGLEVTLLFDPETSLLARRHSSTPEQRRKKQSTQISYSNYTNLGGMFVPGHVEGFEDGTLKQEANIQELVILEDVPDVYFADPSLAFP